MDRPLMEFRLTAAPFGPRAPELLRAALECLEEDALSAPVRCAAAILSVEGKILAARTEFILREPLRHALMMTVTQMLHTPERRILMAAVVRQDEGRPPKLMLPCGTCRTLLHAYGGPDLRIVHLSEHSPELTIIALKELLPLADGGPGLEVPDALFKTPQE